MYKVGYNHEDRRLTIAFVTRIDNFNPIHDKTATTMVKNTVGKLFYTILNDNYVIRLYGRITLWQKSFSEFPDPDLIDHQIYIDYDQVYDGANIYITSAGIGIEDHDDKLMFYSNLDVKDDHDITAVVVNMEVRQVFMGTQIGVFPDHDMQIEGSRSV